MDDKLYRIKGKGPLEYTARDHEDTVRNIVAKLEIGKERMRPLFEKKKG